MLRNRLPFLVGGLVLALAAGCAGGPPPQPAELPMESTVISAEFDEVWQATRRTLQERDLRIYTRDKRGLFVAFDERRRRFSIPRRTRITVVLERVTTSTTRVSVEAVRERYRMPMLRHPGWRELEAYDVPETRKGILADVEAQSRSASEA